MSNYKNNTLSDRDALFGGGGGSKNKPERPRRQVQQNSTTSAPTTTTAKGYQPKRTTTTAGSTTTTTKCLTGDAREAKLREALEYRNAAKKCMSRGVFSKADPVAASMYYKRAADAYQLVGNEPRLEKIHRVASAECQMQQGAYATAAADYTRAAQLCLLDNKEMSLEQARQEAFQLHSNAANAFVQMGEMGKAAECKVRAALALVSNDDEDTTLLSKDALAKMEEAVEAHVADPLNRCARYRQLGISAFVDPETTTTGGDFSADVLALAKDHMVNKAYAHEPLHQLVKVFCHYGEYASALYAAGAATAILEADGISTRSLSKNYLTETILFLAMGDPVAAERAFLDWHVQKTFYLTSRECKLAEELFRAILSRDAEELDEARSPTGTNRAALANLDDEAMRSLVQQLRISGVARKSRNKNDNQQEAPKKTSSRARKVVDEELQVLEEQVDYTPQVTTAAAVAAPAVSAATATIPARKTGDDSESSSIDDDDDDDDGERMDPAALRAEMDDLMNDLGLDDDSDDDEDDSDDDIDLR